MASCGRGLLQRGLLGRLVTTWLWLLLGLRACRETKLVLMLLLLLLVESRVSLECLLCPRLLLLIGGNIRLQLMGMLGFGGLLLLGKLLLLTELLLLLLTRRLHASRQTCCRTRVGSNSALIGSVELLLILLLRLGLP